MKRPQLKTRPHPPGSHLPALLGNAVAVLVGLTAPLAAQAQERGRVISSTPIMMPVAVPREVCTDRSVSEGSRSSGAGALIGGIAGGAAGNAMGNGSGRAAATAIGIIGGAMLGNQIEGSGQKQNRLVRECSTQTVYENRATAFDVVYEYAGQRYSVRMADDPGEFVELQLNPVGALQEPVPEATTHYAPPYGQPYPQPYAPAHAPQYAPQYVAPQYAVPQYISPPITRIIVTPDHYHTPPPRVIYPPPLYYRPDRPREGRDDRRDGRRDDRGDNRRDDRRDQPHESRRDDRRDDRRQEQQRPQGSREERQLAPPIPIGRPLHRAPGNSPYPSDL